ncbi:MAG: hypothetical protein WA048_00785 [Minisyncoccia bacterium]
MRATLMDVRILWFVWQYENRRPTRSVARRDLNKRFLRMFREIARITGKNMCLPGRPDDEKALDKKSDALYCRMEEEWDKIMMHKS